MYLIAMSDINAVSSLTDQGQRKYDRIKIANAFDVLWRAREFNCKMANLSPEGALFRCEFPVQASDVIRLIFNPVDFQASLYLTARVVRVEKKISNYFGVTFQNVPIRAKVLLRQYIYRHTPALEYVNVKRVSVHSAGVRYVKESHRWD